MQQPGVPAHWCIFATQHRTPSMTRGLQPLCLDTQNGGGRGSSGRGSGGLHQAGAATGRGRLDDAECLAWT